MDEYKRRIASDSDVSALESQAKQVDLALKRLKSQEDRITDAYMHEAMDLDIYTREMKKIKAARAQFEASAKDAQRGWQNKLQTRMGLTSCKHSVRSFRGALTTWISTVSRS